MKKAAKEIPMPSTVCSTTHLYHYLFNPTDDAVDSFLKHGIRPLSDFPDSPRWKQLQENRPGFYENLYKMMAEPVLQKPYVNSGIFITPIDFRLLPGTYLHNKPRFNIPIGRIDQEWAVMTYVINDKRICLPFGADALEEVAELWEEKMVREWFGVDNTKMFFYVPQVAAYQPFVSIEEGDYEPGSA
jgi:hypothetical protein